MRPCIAFVGCMFHCDQTNAPTDIFLVPLETLSQGQLIGTNYASLGALVWPQESKNSTAVFRVKYTVHYLGIFGFQVHLSLIQSRLCSSVYYMHQHRSLYHNFEDNVFKASRFLEWVVGLLVNLSRQVPKDHHNHPQTEYMQNFLTVEFFSETQRQHAPKRERETKVETRKSPILLSQKFSHFLWLQNHYNSYVSIPIWHRV